MGVQRRGDQERDEQHGLALERGAARRERGLLAPCSRRSGGNGQLARSRHERPAGLPDAQPRRARPPCPLGPRRCLLHQRPAGRRRGRQGASTSSVIVGLQRGRCADRPHRRLVPARSHAARPAPNRGRADAPDRVLLAQNGKVLAGPDDVVGTNISPLPEPKYVTLGDTRYRAVSAPILEANPPLTLVVSTPKATIDDAVGGLRERFLLFAFAALAVVALLAWLLGRTIVRSLKELADAAGAVARGPVRPARPRPRPGRARHPREGLQRDVRSRSPPSAGACRRRSTASGRRSPPPTIPSRS